MCEYVYTANAADRTNFFKSKFNWNGFVSLYFSYDASEFHECVEKIYTVKNVRMENGEGSFHDSKCRMVHTIFSDCTTAILTVNSIEFDQPKQQKLFFYQVIRGTYTRSLLGSSYVLDSSFHFKDFGIEIFAVY